MNSLTEKEYVNEIIANVKHYIEFNEREDDKDFFAHKELELYKKARKYIELTEELGCPLEVVFKALKQMFVFHKENIKIELLGLHIKSNELYLYGFVEDTTKAVYLYLKDYKKTWWLSETKED